MVRPTEPLSRVYWISGYGQDYEARFGHGKGQVAGIRSWAVTVTVADTGIIAVAG